VAVAAHAVALEATLVTDNVEHVKRIVGSRIENWRSGAS
jgi:predicted nucleic acid-binding protein